MMITLRYSPEEGEGGSVSNTNVPSVYPYAEEFAIILILSLPNITGLVDN